MGAVSRRPSWPEGLIAAGGSPATPAWVRAAVQSSPSRVRSIRIIPQNVPELLHAGDSKVFVALPVNGPGQVVTAALGRVRFQVVNPNPSDRVARVESVIRTSDLVLAVVRILPAKGPLIARNSSARVFATVGSIRSKPVLVTSEAAPFDGAYAGSYSGSVSGFGYSGPVQGAVSFTVSGGTIVVTVPSAGSGQVTRTGSGSFITGSGSVAGATFTAHFIRWPSGAVTANGTWSVDSGGVTGGGTWSATLTR
jgi:hypothetical protein